MKLANVNANKIKAYNFQNKTAVSKPANSAAISKPANLASMLKSANSASMSKQQTNVANNSVINNIRDYGNSIKANRLRQQSTSNNIKKLKYHFKSIASKIIRSKTSSSARQVVGEAKREILRLKRDKQSGKYNSEEMDAAITHAKAMERIARKKVKHLEEEEMAKATGGPCADRPIDEEEIKERKKEAYDKLKESMMGKEDSDDNVFAGEIIQWDGGYDEFQDLDDWEDFNFEDLELFDSALLDANFDISDMEDGMEVLMSLMNDMTAEMMDEFAQSMQEMLEEMGLDELSDGAMARRGDMEPADLKAMKIKHRNKEMKEMVKADAEYLKVIFDQLEKARSGGESAIASSGNGGGVTIASSGNGGGVTMASSSQAPTIDFSL